MRDITTVTHNTPTLMPAGQRPRRMETGTRQLRQIRWIEGNVTANSVFSLPVRLHIYAQPYRLWWIGNDANEQQQESDRSKRLQLNRVCQSQ